MEINNDFTLTLSERRQFLSQMYSIDHSHIVLIIWSANSGKWPNPFRSPIINTIWEWSIVSLCWFQTNLPLAALPQRRLASLAVSELQLSAATPLWLFTERQSLPSWIEFNCLRSAAVGKAARLSIYWLDAACRLVIPLRQVALAQLN